MHLLVAAHDCYPDPGSGGTGRYVYETARRLVDRGHRVSVVTRRRGAVPAREVVDGIECYRYDLAIAGRSAATVLQQLPRAAAAVTRHVDRATADRLPDVVSFQGPATAALVHRAVDRAVPRVATFHSPWPTEYRLRTRGPDGAGGLRRRLNAALRRVGERRLLAAADGVVTLSEYMRGELRRVYGRSFDATVVPGGVDAERFAPAGRTDDRVQGDPAFLTVRRLSERMGHGLLLSAFARVVEAHPGARLYVAGDGPLRGRLEAAARARGVADATTFLGYVPDDDLPAVYRSADVFVLPTTALEGFGLATLEALASGLPVVATPVGGTVELLADLADEPAVVGPVLVEAADPGALAAGMDAWAELSAADRAAAGRACRRYAVERYGWDRTVTSLLDVYGEVRGGGPADGEPVGRARQQSPLSGRR